MYTIDYFIEKFEKIPEENWYTGTFVNPNNSTQRCAFGHCGVDGDKVWFANEIPESKELENIARKGSWSIPAINDGNSHFVVSKFGSTPKQRVVNYLKSLKEKI